MDPLIFIDTNIFLDFYRIRSSDVSIGFLDLIEKHQDRIITGSQIEMEYKKNRQEVILDSLKNYKTPDWGGLTPPAFLSDAQPTKIITKNRKEITSQRKKLKRRIEAILRNPSGYDPVFKVLQRLFKKKSPHNLSRDKKIRYKIRRLAWKRFILGYPPRKDNDTSIGDAVNWEWIIHCANKSGKDIIIVTRDSDYGPQYNKDVFLNDWLHQEFKERVSRKRKIFITNLLTHAFKQASITVTKKEEKEEASLIIDKSSHKMTDSAPTIEEDALS